MKFRTTGILLLIALTIGAFIWFFERHAGDTETRKLESRLVLDVDPGRIDWFQIETTNYLVSCERDGKTWTMIEPVHTRANAGEIQKILSYLEDWQRRETIRAEDIKKSGLDRGDYGVHIPKLKMTLRSDGEEQEFRVGRNTPLGEDLYVQVAGKSDIFAASTNLWSVIPEETTLLRSRRVFDGVPSDIRRFHLKRKDGLLEAKRSETQGWVLEQPMHGRANMAFVNDLLFSFFSAGVEAFVFDEASELSPYGLDTPRAQISLWTDEDQEPQVLLLGDVKEDAAELVYAMREGGKTVIAVQESLLTSASMDAAVLRDRRLTDMDERAVSYLQIIAGEESLSLQKDDAGSWSLVKPVQRKAEDSLVWDLVTMWSQVGIKDFVADDAVNLAEYGLSPPVFELNFFATPPSLETVMSTNTQEVVDAVADGADGNTVTSIRIALGSVDAEKERLMVQVGHTPSVVAVDLRMLRRLSVTPSFYFDREVLALAAEDIREIKLQSSGLTQMVARADTEEFRIAEDSGRNGALLVSGQVQTLLDTLQSLEAESFVPQHPEGLSAYGLDQPEGELTLGLTGEAGISKSLIMGAPLDEHGVYAMIRGQDVIFVLSTTLRDTLMDPLYAANFDSGGQADAPTTPMHVEP